MNVVLSYPIPLQNDHNWEEFKPEIEQFRATWIQFPPEIDCELHCVCLGNEATPEVKELFDGFPATFHLYDGSGLDIGAHQWLAHQLPECWQVCMSTRTFFHRSGWLRYMAKSIELYGDGLYGTCASREGGTLHFRTNFWAINSVDLKSYPVIVDCRKKAELFECGNDPDQPNILDFCELELKWPSYLVLWSGVRRKEDFFTAENIFRRGLQDNCLAWDHHHVRWFKADDEERERLSALCFGVDLQAGKA